MEDSVKRTLIGMNHYSPSPEAQVRLSTVRGAFKDLVDQIGKEKMDGRSRALTLTKLEEALMWAIKGIVLEDMLE